MGQQDKYVNSGSSLFKLAKDGADTDFRVQSDELVGSPKTSDLFIAYISRALGVQIENVLVSAGSKIMKIPNYPLKLEV